MIKEGRGVLKEIIFCCIRGAHRPSRRATLPAAYTELARGDHGRTEWMIGHERSRG
jgi:hypothetical protein